MFIGIVSVEVSGGRSTLTDLVKISQASNIFYCYYQDGRNNGCDNEPKCGDAKAVQLLELRWYLSIPRQEKKYGDQTTNRRVDRRQQKHSDYNCDAPSAKLADYSA